MKLLCLSAPLPALPSPFLLRSVDMADKPTNPPTPPIFDAGVDHGDESDAKEMAARLKKAFSQKELDAIKRELDG